MDTNEVKALSEKLAAKNHFMNLLGIRLVEVEPDHCVVEMVAREEVLNPLEIVHGGAMYTMADVASAMAVRTKGLRQVTLNSTFNFLRAGKKGDTLRAEAKVRRRGRSTSLTEVDVTDSEGKLLCTGTYTFFYIQD